MASPTPHTSQPAAHERGVFLEPYRINGLLVYAVHRCDGECMELAMIHPEWNSERIASELEASLEAGCPSDPDRHRLICGASRPKLTLLSSA